MIITDNTKLHTICESASKEESIEIIGLLENELETSNKFGVEGIGLAAPQIGINKRVAIVRIGHLHFNLVNCTIGDKYNKTISEEGCLSLPGKFYNIERYNQIVIQDNELGNIIKFSAYGLPAVAIQHEMDHWDGILISDKAIVEHKTIGPNMPCPCGKKLKYKKCCGKILNQENEEV